VKAKKYPDNYFDAATLEAILKAKEPTGVKNPKNLNGQCRKNGNNRVQLKGITRRSGRKVAETRLFGTTNMQFQHLIGTAYSDPDYRPCIIWVGGNRNLFELVNKKYLPIGPQEDAIEIQYQQAPKMWRYSKTYSEWTPNHVAAHVEIQTRKKKNSKWETQGNWLIPTTVSSNSRAGKRCLWHTLRVGVTAIKLPPEAQENSCPL